MIVDTKVIAESIYNKIILHKNLFNYSLLIVIIGDDLASIKYANLKLTKGKEFGINVKILHFVTNTAFEEIINQINFQKSLILEENKNSIVGLIFQLPILNLELRQKLLQRNIWTDNNLVDIDFLNLSQNFFDSKNLPPTIGAIDEIINFLGYESLAGKSVAMIGQGELVGKNMVKYLLSKNTTFFSFNKFSKNVAEFVSKCDIVISAAGSPKLINQHFLNINGQLLIDASTSDENGKLVGDIDLENVQIFIDENKLHNKIKIVKSPGGVGPLTVLKLFANLINM